MMYYINESVYKSFVVSLFNDDPVEPLPLLVSHDPISWQKATLRKPSSNTLDVCSFKTVMCRNSSIVFLSFKKRVYLICLERNTKMTNASKKSAQVIPIKVLTSDNTTKRNQAHFPGNKVARLQGMQASWLGNIMI